MDKLITLALLFSFATATQSQSQSQKVDIPMHTYKFSSEISSGLSTGEMRTAKAAQYYSYIGQYQHALSIPNEVEMKWGFETFDMQDREYLDLFSPQPAVNAIVEQAKNERVIILNEAHHKPQHRVFVSRLLQKLYDQGYRHFGLEAIANCAWVPKEYCDSLMNERGFPYNSPLSGTYVTEPQMSNLISKAIEIGFNVFPFRCLSRVRHSVAYAALFNAPKPTTLKAESI